jgi:hypothetical protein
MPAPATATGRLCGGMATCGKPRRRPMTIAQTSAATPAFTCTTMPPAKSMIPALASQPPPQTQCATGTYTSISHSALNHSTTEKRTRSA